MPPGQCPGNTQANSVCVVCQGVACPFGTYQKACSQNTDTVCIPYTQCVPGNTTLRNRGLTNDGVCLACTNCSRYGLKTLANCSQYQDTLCNGTVCSGQTPCANLVDRNFFCNMDAAGARQASRNTTGVCGLCPDGYSSDGLYCYECPSGVTCSRTGAVQCSGVVPVGYEPQCIGEYASTGGACPYTPVATQIVTRSTFLRPNGNCAPYFQCTPGYFKHFVSTGQVLCDPCDASLKPANFSWFSEGLSANDPSSCMYECAGVSQWPGGACASLAGRNYIPSNDAGYYDAGPYGGGVQKCPLGFTSVAGQAQAASDCQPCPYPRGTLGNPCGEWLCRLGMVRIGGVCFDPTMCPSNTGYSYALTGLCVPTPLPWQPAGFQKIQSASGAGPSVTVSQVNQSSTSSDLISAVVQAPSGPALVFYSTPYGLSQRHWLAVNSSWNVYVPGRVCSGAVLVVGGRQYVLMAFCNSSFLSFLDLTLASPKPRLLIGSSTPGYQEGFRDLARFDRILYVAIESQTNAIYVSDTLNCAIRLVSIPVAPGDFLTRSFWVYGASAGTCDTGALAILRPGPLYPVLNQTYFVFAATDGLYQLDSGMRNVVQILASSAAPAWMPTLSLLLSVGLGSDTSTLVLGFASVAAVLAPVQQRCPSGFTSYAGGTCTVSCSTTTNYVDQGTGLCLPCVTRACVTGEQLIACTPISPQTCQACPALSLEQGLYRRIYNNPGSCALSNTLYVAPCPKGFYASTVTIGGLTVCKSCPLFSTTFADGQTSIDQCRCYDGATKSSSGNCTVGQIYPLPTLSRCPFGTYARGAFETCSSCRKDPFPQCAVGSYPLSNGSCVPCLVPYSAVPVAAGLAVNSPTSCGFACLPGYYPYSGASYLTKCYPCTNAPAVGSTGAQYYALSNGQQDSPRGCSWQCRFPFKIYNDQCVPCTPMDPLRMGLSCTLPGFVMNSSAGAGVQATLGNLTYRLIRFNASGYLQFSQNITVDVLLVGGGGAGGGVQIGLGGGGGGGAGQLLLAYGVRLLANVSYTVTVGAGGTWASAPGVAAKSSSFAGLLAIYGGNGGGAYQSSPSGGSVGASGGGTGSPYTEYVTTGGAALAGYPGGGTTGGFMAGGGGGAGCAGGTSQQCAMAGLTGGNGEHSGAGGCGTVMWANASATLFFAGASPVLAAGGGGGSSWPLCPAGTAQSGAGAGGGGAASPNTGSGGGGASSQSRFNSFTPGGAGGSGVVVVRYVDAACVCGN